MTYFNAPLEYRAASLETAACLWEAVLEMEAADGVFDDPETVERSRMIRAAREALGTAHLRLTVIGWANAVDAAWKDADGDESLGSGGQFGGPFDWEFVPQWIAANVDWSNPHDPHMIAAQPTA